MQTKKILKYTALILALLITFGNLNFASANNEAFADINEFGYETTQPSSDLVDSFKISKSLAVVGTEVKGRFSYDFGSESSISLGYIKPNKEVQEIYMEYNEDSGNYEFSFITDQVGYWTLAYINVNGTIYHGPDFYGSYKTVETIEEVFPDQSYPYIDGTNLEDGSTIKQSDVMNAIGQVRFFDGNGNNLPVNVTISGDGGVYNYEVENDGLSITTSSDSESNPNLGNYTATFEHDGKVVEKQITIVDDSADASYVYLASLPIIDVEYPEEELEVSLSAVQLSAVGQTIRLSGDSRFSTAVKISSENFKSAKNAVIVNAYNFPDALAGVSYASAIDGPILFASKDSIDRETIDELRRLGVSQVTIIGGVNSVSANVVEQIAGIGVKIQRISSSSRYSTALEIAGKLRQLKSYDKAIIVNAFSHPDALSAGAYSGKMGYPIIYTDPSGIGAYTIKIMQNRGVKEFIIVGGNKSVSSNVEKQLKDSGASVSRISGSDRYETSLNFANKFYNKPSTITIANGADFPDALAGGPVAAANNAPLLLTPSTSLNAGIKKILEDGNVVRAVVFGGNNSVAADIFSSVKDMVTLNSNRVEPEPKPTPSPAPSPKPNTSDKKPEVPKVPVLNIEKRVPTADNPIRIVLDQGHGYGYNKGVVEGYYEGNAMYWYGLILKNELVKYGFEVKTTRNDLDAEERSLIGSKYLSTNGISLQERGAMGEGYDLLLSLHTNALSWTTPNYDKARGTEIFDSTTSPRKDLAEQLCSMIADHFGHPNRGVKYKYDEDGTGKNWYGVLRNSKATHSMLVEHGFHTNLEDCTLLMDRDFKIEMAQKTAKLLADYYGMPAN